MDKKLYHYLFLTSRTDPNLFGFYKDRDGQIKRIRVI